MTRVNTYLLLLIAILTLINCNANKKSSAQTSKEITQTSDLPDIELSKIRPGVWLHTSYNTFKGQKVPS